MTEQLSLLVTAGHPADAFDAVGGTIAKHTDRGDQVTVAVMTHGVKTHSWNLMAQERTEKASATDADVQAQIGIKEEEIRDGLAILGVSADAVRFIGVDDAFLHIDEKIVWDLAEIIREVRPHIVITQSPLEQNGVADQHALCGQMTLMAIRLAAGVMPGNPRPPFGVFRVYIEASGGKTTSLEYERNRFPHILINVEDVVERKVKAIDTLKSQFYDGDLGRKMAEVRSFIWGLHQRLAYVEAFQLYEPLVYSHLPVPEYDFQRARTPMEKQFRDSGRLIAPFVKREA
jgi:LmbE family N-acetylglucosaminyl deacetylase